MAEKIYNLTFKIALLIFIIDIVILAGGIFILNVDVHQLLICNIVFTSLACLLLGMSWDDIEASLKNGIERAVTSLFIFILIGMLIGIWTQSGTVPGLVYYGLEFLSPKFFLPAGFIACSIMSFATGTCWGTGGTLGVALIGMGTSMGMDSALVAGMVISGCYFGDKMSPISDTNILSTSNAGADIYGHIVAMSKTTIPSFLISLVLYTVIGLKYASRSYDISVIVEIQSELANIFTINPLVLIPLLMLIVICVMKMPAVPSLFAGVVAGSIISLLVQRNSIRDIFISLNYGFNACSTNEIVFEIVNNGGIQDMMWTFSLAFIATAFGGLLEDSGILSTLINKIGESIKSCFGLVSATLLSSIFSNIVMGENYLSSIINSRLWGPMYDRLGLQRRMLSRLVEEGANLTSALIPWTTAGAFFYGTFKISPLEYAPFAFLNYINPLLTIVLAFFGRGLIHVPDKGKKDPYYEYEIQHKNS